jgi:exodeoxyribonuclease VII large subunit
LTFEQLKQRLASEGLFHQDHKKLIPAYPRSIGIVTSPTGAAIRDMINIIGRRFPAVELILSSVRVQGEGAAKEIAQAIRDQNEFGRCDVMIVGRGGGSLEDLWAFNEEVVARAIYASSIPVISAIGHEIDFTIADFVADLRAPTPSAAAELVVRDFGDIVENLRHFKYTVEKIVAEEISSKKERIHTLTGSYAFNRPFDLVRQYSQRLDELKRTLIRGLGQRLAMLFQEVSSYQKRITSMNPDAVLERGYSMVLKNGDAIGRARLLHDQDDVQIKFHDGLVRAKIG